MSNLPNRQREYSDDERNKLIRFIEESSREDILSFVQYTKPDYIVGSYHEALAEILQQFVDGKIKKLMIYAPPQTGKSEIVSRRLPAFLLGKNPDLRIVGASYSADLATAFNKDVQRIIDDEKYHTLFPKTVISGSMYSPANSGFVRNQDKFEVVGFRGYLKSVGVGGSLTGTSCDIAIIDDPVKDAAEANSATIRESKWQWYLTVLKTRLHDNSQQLLTMTRWHHDDLAGRILASEEGKEWQVFKFPAIKRADVGNKYDKRKNGEALFPQRHSVETLLGIERLSTRVFTSLYQQDPSDEEGSIWKKWFIPIPDNEFPAPEEFENYGTDWDTAYSDQDQADNADTAYVVSGKKGNYMYIDRIGFFQAGFPEMVSRMQTQPAPHYIEAKASGKSAAQTLRTAGVPAIEITVSGGDKIARANLSTPFPEGQLVYCRASILEVLYYHEIQGILKFPNGKKKDLADALAQAIQRHFNTKRKLNVSVY